MRRKGFNIVWALLLCLMVPSGALGQFPGLQRVVTTDSLKVRNIADFDSTATIQYLVVQDSLTISGGLTANWDAGGYEIRSLTFESDVTTGTAPFTIASTTLVSNLNVDLLDGQTDTYYLDSDNFTGTEWDSLTDGSDIYLHIHDVRYYTETELDVFLAAKEDTISAGITAQYWRGDKSWQTLDTSVVPENTNLYYTAERVDDRMDAVLQDLAGKLTWTYDDGAGTITPVVTYDSQYFSGTDWTDLTDAGDTTIHIHDSRYYTETEIDGGQLDGQYVRRDGTLALTANWDAGAYSIISSDTIQAEHLYSTDDVQVDGQLFINSANAMLAHVNITGDAASIDDREYGLWMRGKVAAYIVQLNVHGSKLEIGGGASLDTTPAFTVDYLSGQIAAPTTGSGAGILIGEDFQIYRSATGVGYTPNSFQIMGTVGVGRAPTSSMMHIKASGDATKGLVMQRFSATGRAQFALEDENGAEIWRMGTTAAGGTDFKFFDQTQDALTMAQNGDVTWNPGGNFLVQKLARFGGASDHTEIETDGDVNFVGGGGLQFGEIFYHGAGFDTDLAAQDTDYQIVGFDTDGESNGNVTPAHGSDHITVGVAGRYKICVSISSRSATANAYEFHVGKNNNAVTFPNTSIHRTTSTANRLGSKSCQAIIDCDANDTIEVWIRRADGGAVTKTITIESITFNLTQIGGT